MESSVSEEIKNFDNKKDSQKTSILPNQTPMFKANPFSQGEMFQANPFLNKDLGGGLGSSQKDIQVTE